MKYTVIMTTFNGEEFLLEQLESIKNQSLEAHEVIIIDDGSQDGTVQCIEEFIHRYKLVHWRLYVNKVTLGWKKNFMSAINKASNEMIFLADQDDIWLREKAKLLLSYMERDLSINVLASNFDKIDEFGYKINAFPHSYQVVKIAFDYNNFRVRRPGCTYVFRKSFFEKIKHFWVESMPHDALLWWCSALDETLAICEYPMIEYRRHANNVSGTKLNRGQIITMLENKQAHLKLLQQYFEQMDNKTDDRKTQQQNKLENLEAYLSLKINGYKKRNLWSITKCVINYSECYSEYASPSNHPVLSEYKNVLFAKKN